MTVRTAPPPSKAHTSFILSMGLVNIPLRVLSGVESTRIERKEFVGGDVNHPVGRRAYDKESGENVDTDNITRMAQATSGAWVILTDEEVAEATMPKGVAEVVSFVPLTKLYATYAAEKVDQVRARTSDMNAAQKRSAERAFGLFLAGLKSRKVAALIKVALRGPARYAAITPEGDMVLLYTADALRQPADMPNVILTEAEKNMMGALIDAYDIGTPVITDDTAATVQAFIDSKAKGVKVAPVVEPTMADDVMAAILASIDAVKAQKKVTA